MADEKISQNEIESLLNQVKDETPERPVSEVSAGDEIKPTSFADETLAAPRNGGGDIPNRSVAGGEADAVTEEMPVGNIPQGDIDALLSQAQEALASVDKAAEELPPGVKRFELSSLAGTPASTEEATLDLIQDVELDLEIELGRTRMHLEEVLQLKRGSVVPLDKLAGDPVDVYVNGRLIARGEVLVLNDNFCIRVAELIAGETSS